jgi:phosphoribosylformylglycinamidine synthase
MKAEITIRLKPAVRDPQGQSIANAMKRMGLEGIEQVRQGKHIEIELTDKVQDAENKIKEICEQLLANPVIEDYSIKMSE